MVGWVSLRCLAFGSGFLTINLNHTADWKETQQLVVTLRKDSTASQAPGPQQIPTYSIKPFKGWVSGKKLAICVLKIVPILRKNKFPFFKWPDQPWRFPPPPQPAPACPSAWVGGEERWCMESRLRGTVPHQWIAHTRFRTSTKGARAEQRHGDVCVERFFFLMEMYTW